MHPKEDATVVDHALRNAKVLLSGWEKVFVEHAMRVMVVVPPLRWDPDLGFGFLVFGNWIKMAGLSREALHHLPEFFRAVPRLYEAARLARNAYINDLNAAILESQALLGPIYTGVKHEPAEPAEPAPTEAAGAAEGDPSHSDG